MTRNVHLIDQLVASGFHRTKSREAICAVLDESTEYLTSGELFSSARREEPTISKASVYRTLRALHSLGLMIQVPVPPQNSGLLAWRAKSSKVTHDTAEPDRSLKTVQEPNLYGEPKGENAEAFEEVVHRAHRYRSRGRLTRVGLAVAKYGVRNQASALKSVEPS